ncbi:DUF4440 domain-containing protein [Salmonirosea aquatica]|uniref:DUF4440 domain-containing protein n=1 Tax=Salmonirosea aquatica TaxID=2654236 RepID=A0A7C9FZE3_9BACT|nr:DUF4440 domain-containing protein [Cytophagaceae bacterium SJW1-29]
MKQLAIYLVLSTLTLPSVQGQGTPSQADKAIYDLIDAYSEAREKQDTILLKKILTTDVDQLVSTGEWRTGIGESVSGMMRSSATKPGTRSLTVEKIRYLNPQSALADARYVIQNDDRTARQMWSTFVVVKQRNQWKISAIRNMLPAK